MENQATAANSKRVIWIFAITIFLSAFLLFQVQLIISKYILPWFGGSAAVWTTSMLVFQVLLLGGYIYSHLISETLTGRTQTFLHSLLLAIAIALVGTLSLLWPSAITPGSAWRPTDNQHPVRGVIIIILLATGFPFFVLSTTGPLLQRWFGQLSGDVRTYRLYSVSNFGSLLGLLSFPFLLEPLVRLKVQGAIWAVLFVGFCISCGWCVKEFSKRGKGLQKGEATLADEGKEPSLWIWGLWLILPATASTLLLATTNQLCQEILSLPFLWVLPLALYLLSFILCFDHPRWYRREIFHPLFAVGLLILCQAIIASKSTVQIIIMPLLLFVSCMICHGELTRLKPGIHRLTSFYLAVSAGGALGGVFVAILAPQIFQFFTEFQCSLATCAILLLICLFMDEHSWIYSQTLWLPVSIPVGVILTLAGIGWWDVEFAKKLSDWSFYPWALVVSTLFLSGAYIQWKSPSPKQRGFRFVQPLAVIVLALGLFGLYKTAEPSPPPLIGERNFYGAIRVFEFPRQGKVLTHGATIHGSQLKFPNDRFPTTYYGPDSGIGIFLQNHPQHKNEGGHLRVGLIGMGAGTLAAYGRSGDYFRFYEIDPQVVSLSAGPQPIFTFVRDSAASIETQIGDGRLLLEKELSLGQAQGFDVLVLDAFSGDAIPVHLLTKEAFEVYFKHLKDDNSVIALHLSSNHVDLMPVVVGIRQYLRYYSLARFTDPGFPYMGSTWVFLARRREALQIPGLTAIPPRSLPRGSPRLWTDDRSDVLRLIY
jgi:hypothetical protein